jgi:hypothetical protein
MQHMPKIRFGRLDPGARPDSLTALLPADVLVSVFAFGNMPPAYRCAHHRGNFIKLIVAFGCPILSDFLQAGKFELVIDLQSPFRVRSMTDEGERVNVNATIRVPQREGSREKVTSIDNMSH